MRCTSFSNSMMAMARWQNGLGDAVSLRESDSATTDFSKSTQRTRMRACLSAPAAAVWMPLGSDEEVEL